MTEIQLLASRMWAKVTRRGGDGCWTFDGYVKNGYGSLQRKGAQHYTHRLSWEIHFGPPRNLFVLHRCDNRRCVRQDHLFLGTQAVNLDDMRSKGRGSKPPRKRVREMSRAGVPQRTIAKQFGVSQHAVSCWITGRTRSEASRHGVPEGLR